MAKEISQFSILQSIADIYYSMHLINLQENTVIEYSAQGQAKDILSKFMSEDAPATVTMVQVITATIKDEQLDEALSFTDVSTIADRMKGKKFISKELSGRNVGWISASFIAVDTDEEDKPIHVIFTTRIIDDEKQREANLLNMSNTDELTGFFNRRAYEDNIKEYNDTATEADFVYVSMDVNGLKIVNDTLGHAAGDELLTGAAECMRQCIAPYGRIFRIGGDEFAAIIFANAETLEAIKTDFTETVLNWSGNLVDSLAIAAGFVALRDTDERSVTRIAQLADKKMYEEKTKYYSRKGVDRRGQKEAHTALCELYTKILKINITDDSYQIVNVNVSEQTAEKGFADKISQWLYNFGMSNQVHPDDLDNYLEKTNINYIRDYFTHGKTSLQIFYKRSFDGVYKQVMMEIIPAKDYTETNETCCLYVKEIDR
ncbi:MAG: GGDEF domain-containing protein [Saccharofermentans sp.]|nr:GGDEF domain-containing protein [Saccharofermentans sp.]